LRVSNRTVLEAGALFALNFYIVHELFRIEYLRFMGSIEGSFLGIARYAMHHWGDLTWFPLWYDGIPYQNTYPPLLHLSVAALATITGISVAHAYHFLIALAYCMGPVTLFMLALRFSGSRVAAFTAGLIYSTLSMSAWVMPAVRIDMGGLFFPRRLQSMLLYGEGPHTMALTLIPLAILAMDLALHKRRAPYFFLAAIALAAAALTNWIGAVSLTLAIGCYLLAKVGDKEVLWKKIALITGIGICAYFLAMPMAPPSTIAVTQVNAKRVEGLFLHVYEALPVRGGALVLAACVLKLATRRLRWHLQFAILFFFLMAVISIFAMNFQVNLVPQASRYQLEMEMGFALLVAFAGQAWLQGRAAVIAMAALIVAVIQPLRLDRNYARNFLLRTVDIEKTVEYREAQWLNQSWSGERVMMSGSVAFFLTAFSDTPELAGGYDPGRLRDAVAIALYQIYSDDGAGDHKLDDSMLWLKTMGVQAIGVSEPGSKEFFKAYRYPEKFKGALEELWREGGDVIYRVGAPHQSLARIVPRAALVSREPVNGIDVDPLRAYVAALDDARMPRAEFQWTSAHSAKIRGALQAGQVISVQEAWHKGWHANAPLSSDAIGLMVVDPGPGAFDIDLVYDGGIEMKIAKILSAATFIFLALLSLRAILKKAW
jgi:hypothetical protein